MLLFGGKKTTKPLGGGFPKPSSATHGAIPYAKMVSQGEKDPRKRVPKVMESTTKLLIQNIAMAWWRNTNYETNAFNIALW